jgi:hypothetical protein
MFAPDPGKWAMTVEAPNTNIRSYNLIAKQPPGLLSLVVRSCRMVEPEGTIQSPRTVGQALRGMTLDTAAILGGAVVIAIGSIGPWATSPLTSESGTSGDGVITLIAAALIALAAFMRGRTLPFLLVLVAGGTGVYDAIHIHDRLARVTFGGVQIDHVGWGVYAVIIGAVITLVGVAKRPRTDHPTLEPPETAP